jgi:hypothetical protein
MSEVKGRPFGTVWSHVRGRCVNSLHTAQSDLRRVSSTICAEHQALNETIDKVMSRLRNKFLSAKKKVDLVGFDPARLMSQCRLPARRCSVDCVGIHNRCRATVLPDTSQELANDRG